MAKRGGYKIVSCVSPTIYNDIEGNYGKPILLTDIVIGGIEKADTFVTFELNGTDFVAKVYDKWFVVSDDNTTSFENLLALGTYGATELEDLLEALKDGLYGIKYSSENFGSSFGIAQIISDENKLLTSISVYDTTSTTIKTLTMVYYNGEQIEIEDVSGTSIDLDDDDEFTIYKI